MTYSVLWLDIETRSQIDLIKHGLRRYAESETTELICLSYAFDNEKVKTWFSEDNKEFPEDILDYFNNTNNPIYAHNASFERNIFNYVIANDFDFNPPNTNRWRCSMARAQAHGLPAKLEDIGRCLKLKQQKTEQGTRLISDYCAPNFLTKWKEGDKELMQQYCETDVNVMRTICSGLRELDDIEWGQYHVTEVLNDRGVPIDVDFASAALDYAEDVKKDVAVGIVELTLGRIKKPTERKARDIWLRERLTPEHLELIEDEESKNIKFDKERRRLLLDCKNLEPDVRAFVELVEEAGGSTISKYTKMVDTQVDNRVYNTLRWNGAAATGRYSSVGLQLQNMKRDVIDNPEKLIQDVKDFAYIDKPTEVLSRLVRASITHKSGLTYSDYSQIEARVLPWLSDCPQARPTLDIFFEDRDLYKENARTMFSLPESVEVDKDTRQAAKVGVLACGFGGGFRAIQAMAKVYGTKYSEEEANKIKNNWRKANPWAPIFWEGLKEAANHAVTIAGKVAHAGRISFLYDGDYWLWMRLPSGRCLAYANPYFEMIRQPWGEEELQLTALWGSRRPKKGEKWPRRSLSHLILSENATQAAAADIMREAIVRAEKAGIKVLFSVHDELVVEGRCKEELHKIMEQPPGWANGLPIAADTQESTRYGK